MLVAETKKNAITKGTDEETIDIILLAIDKDLESSRI
jgi:hypothetical protein